MKKYKGWVSKEAYLQNLYNHRKVFIANGAGMSVLEINEEINKIEKQLKATTKKLSTTRKIVLAINTLKKVVNVEASQQEIEDALKLLESIKLKDLND